MARTDGQAGSADERDAPNGPGGPDRLRATTTVADRRSPWSREDLQQRLERLPRGHPSSPRNADGSRKPPPPSLRALELPAPAVAPADGAAPAARSADRAGDPGER